MIRRALMQISIPSRVTTTAGWLLLAPRVAAAFSSHAPSLIVAPLPSFAIHSVLTRACNTQYSFRIMSSSSSLAGSSNANGADIPLSPTKWSYLLSNTNPTSNKIYWAHATDLFPPLTPTAHKGSHGRIAIFGGSEKYTGAPYYAAQSALHAGIDLATVFCANEAAVPIKCYSPELMVQGVYSVADLDALLQEENALLEELEQCKHQNEVEVNESDVLATMEKLEQQQLLIQNELKNNDDDKMEVLVERLANMKRVEENLCQLRERRDVAVNVIVDTITDMFPTLHALCIGPGLGRHPLVFLAVEKVIQKAMARDLSLVLDADALFMLSLTEYRSLLKDLHGYERCVMTPNSMEMKRLDKSTAAGDDNADEKKYDSSSIIVQKGHVDKIIQGDKIMQCEEEGGLKRSGGIGDVLAGTISAFMAWNAVLEMKSDGSISGSSAVNGRTGAMQQPQHYNQQRQFASWAACVAVKRATRVAYQTKRRAMSAMDVIGEIGQVLDGMESGLALEISNQVEQEKSKSLQG